MPHISALIDHINKLSNYASVVTEESYRITILGDSLDQAIADELINIHKCTLALEIDSPVFISSGDPIDVNDRDDYSDFFNESWSIILGKTALINKLPVRENAQIVIFFSTQRFSNWLLTLDPFTKNSERDPDFSEPVTIYVNGLQESFGGPSIWVMPIGAEKPVDIKETKLPESSDVHSLIHINSDCLMSVCPKGWALNWGNMEQPEAKKFAYLSAMVLSACLVQELKRTENNLVVTLRGTKLISPVLNAKGYEEDVVSFLPTLIETVEWVYSEREETRLKLITDRLSIDISQEQTLLSGMKMYLAEALKQARDSYSFVILERKDAYHKEMRELMKDMKAQADLYAAKVRDLVSSLTRDILGVLVFLGFSFIGKFDDDRLKVLLSSGELSLLMKFMAGYLVLSLILQLATHWRDAHLSYSESKKWLSVLQNYTSRDDNQQRFTAPIDQRRSTFFIAMIITSVLYLLLALLIWNLPFVAKLLLAQ
ncbi:MAG: hypothetical protein Q8J59_11645 [Methylotenera sp.]|nr:hypothetical protein [Methylotenera sp.]MDP2282324.1 hypothetical protein [Methylotenera sp.]MDP3061428.1 hypothetical protein [Methylotenera sp.]